MHRGGATWAPPGHRLRQQFFAGRNLAPAYRRSTAGTEIIENLPIGQHQKQPLAHWHRAFALLAVQAGSREIFKLLLVHTRRRSRSVESRAELWRAAELRQPRSPVLAGNTKALASILFRKYRGVAE